MLKNKAFAELNIKQKAAFFAKCQEILISNHPKSGYLATSQKINEYIGIFRRFHERYKGFYHQTDSTCLLYNLIELPPNPSYQQMASALVYREPAPNFNAISIDFLTTSSELECLSLYQEIYDPRMKDIIYLRGGQVKKFPLTNNLSVKNLAAMFRR